MVNWFRRIAVQLSGVDCNNSPIFCLSLVLEANHTQYRTGPKYCKDCKETAVSGPNPQVNVVPVALFPPQHLCCTFEGLGRSHDS